MKTNIFCTGCTGYGFVYHNGGWRCSLLKLCNSKEECNLVTRQGFGTIFIQRVEGADSKKCPETTTSKTSDKTSTTAATTKKKDETDKTTKTDKKTTKAGEKKSSVATTKKPTTKKPTTKKPTTKNNDDDEDDEDEEDEADAEAVTAKKATTKKKSNVDYIIDSLDGSATKLKFSSLCLFFSILVFICINI